MSLSKTLIELDYAKPEEVRANEENSDLRLDLKERTKALMEGLGLVCGDHKMPLCLILLLRDQLLDHFKKIDPLVFYGGSIAELKRIQKLRKEPYTDEEENEMMMAEKVWVEECKYLLTYPFAKYLRNDPPKKPASGGFRPVGALKRWMKARLHAENPGNYHLWYSWLQAKRSCLPYSDRMVESLFMDHRDALSKEDPVKENPNSFLSMCDIMEDKTFKKVLSIVAEDLQGSLQQSYERRAWVEAPTNANACWEMSRGEGGKVSTLRLAAGLDTQVTVNRSDLYRMSYHPHAYKDGGVAYNFVEERRITSDWELWDTLKYKSFKNKNMSVDEYSLAKYQEYMEEKVLMLGELERYNENPKAYGEVDFELQFFLKPGFDYEKYWEGRPVPEVKWVGVGERLKCEVACVLEPNKGRMVSKGEAIPYQMAKPLQQSMLKAIQRFPCFKLTGRPFCPTDLYPLLEKAERNFLWHSVDYSAATDNLSMEYSSMVLGQIIRRLPRDLQDLAFMVLGPHEVSYPAESSVGDFDQTNGQLMGSVLSFPILCLCNLGLYLQCTRDWQVTSLPKKERWSHNERLRHVIINGDDMLYCSPERHTNSEGKEIDLWDRHVRFGKNIGLEMSVGKAYRHRRYVNINSTSVLYDLRKLIPEYETELIWNEDGAEEQVKRGKNHLYGRGTESPRQINFLNVGLALNRHKVQGRSDEEPAEEREKWMGRERKRMRKKGLSEAQIDEHLYFEVLSRDRFLGLDRRFRALYAESHTHEDSRKGIVENIPLCLEGCRDEKSRRNLLEFILDYHRDEIKRQTTHPIHDLRTKKRFLMTRNLFLPLNVGGMGVNPPVGFRFKITPSQSYLAKDLIRNYQQWCSRPLKEGLYEACPTLSIEMLPWMKPEILYEKQFNRVFSVERVCTRKGLLGFFGKIPTYSPCFGEVDDDDVGFVPKCRYDPRERCSLPYKPPPFDEVCLELGICC